MTMHRARNPRRIRYRETVIALSIIALIGIIGFRAIMRLRTNAPQSTAVQVRWQYENNTWSAIGEHPACESPLFTMSPIETSTVLSVMYPGSEQAGQFNDAATLSFGRADVTVRLPMTAQLVAARHDGTDRYSLTFLNSCGIAQRYDGLGTLTSRLANYFAQNSVVLTTTDIQKQIPDGLHFNAGEAIASTVALNNMAPQLSVAVYDLRGPNAISKNKEWKMAHAERPAEVNYAICWINLLPTTDQGRLREGAQTTQTDYCQ